jgi:predicted nucleotidyltransferase
VTAVFTEPVAGTLIVIDELGSATLTDIARATGKPVSSVQRAVHSLINANVLVREWSRGPFAFAPAAPRLALRELAQWTLGPGAVTRLLAAVSDAGTTPLPDAPATIKNPRIRRAWPHALKRIVSTYHPKRVVLFGSQARGDADLQSDVDLLVVFDEIRDRQERRVQIARLLGDMPFAKDVLVAATDDLSHPLRGGALAEAIRDGVVVYER